MPEISIEQTLLKWRRCGAYLGANAGRPKSRNHDWTPKLADVQFSFSWMGDGSWRGLICQISIQRFISIGGVQLMRACGIQRMLAGLGEIAKPLAKRAA
ncbi:hypothetical protein IAG41_22390 [Sphingomonas sp. JC676]|uniref:hypothetical protein n=1 Tax=Sphingomonas sp. JC676 TaxID=2768065 RepID=UPI001657DE0F|nr:hypothetical protein [Sphingomonas sp. JC676]MBC9035148.1 hypothetical protein [Sphingomonas sp. JC676]